MTRDDFVECGGQIFYFFLNGWSTVQIFPSFTHAMHLPSPCMMCFSSICWAAFTHAMLIQVFKLNMDSLEVDYVTRFRFYMLIRTFWHFWSVPWLWATARIHFNCFELRRSNKHQSPVDSSSPSKLLDTTPFPQPTHSENVILPHLSAWEVQTCL